MTMTPDEAVTAIKDLLLASFSGAFGANLPQRIYDLAASGTVRPPTAKEVREHIAAGGQVESWHIASQTWTWDTDAARIWLRPDRAEPADPSTPQHGLRLVPLGGPE